MIKKQKIPHKALPTDLPIDIDDFDQRSGRGSLYKRYLLESQQKELEAQLRLQKVKEPAHFTRKYLERIQTQTQRENSSKSFAFEHLQTANRKPKTQDSKNPAKNQSMTNLLSEIPPEISIDSNSDKFKTERFYLDIIKLYHQKVLQLASTIQECRKEKSNISAQRKLFSKQREKFYNQREIFNHQRQTWSKQRENFNKQREIWRQIFKQQRQDWRKQRYQIKAESFKDKFQLSYRIRTLERQKLRLMNNNQILCKQCELLRFKRKLQTLRIKAIYANKKGSQSEKSFKTLYNNILNYTQKSSSISENEQYFSLTPHNLQFPSINSDGQSQFESN